MMAGLYHTSLNRQPHKNYIGSSARAVVADILDADEAELTWETMPEGAGDCAAAAKDGKRAAAVMAGFVRQAGDRDDFKQEN